MLILHIILSDRKNTTFTVEVEYPEKLEDVLLDRENLVFSADMTSHVLTFPDRKSYLHARKMIRSILKDTVLELTLTASSYQTITNTGKEYQSRYYSETNPDTPICITQPIVL